MVKRGFGELELSVLKMLSDGKKWTVMDMHRALGGKDKYTTILTVMNRLVQKKELARERNGLRCTYWIVQSEGTFPSFIKVLKKKLFGFKPAEVVSCLLDGADELTEEELDQMQKMIAEAKQKRKDRG